MELYEKRLLDRKGLLLKLYFVLEVEQVYLDRNFNIDSLCEKLNVERTTLFKLVRIRYGLTPFRLIRFLRVNHMKHLIYENNGEISNLEILMDSGYRNIGQMVSSFKREVGVSLFNYKKKVKKGLNRAC